jgi:predicted transcriptional regulator
MWYRVVAITEWFGEMAERYRLIRNFNRAAKESFIVGEAATLLEARITRGESAYRHVFSKFMAGGMRIKAMSGRPMDKSELVEVGRVVLDQDELVRKLISLGWDTLEVHSNKGSIGVKWALKDYAKMGGYLK